MSRYLSFHVLPPLDPRDNRPQGRAWTESSAPALKRRDLVQQPGRRSRGAGRSNVRSWRLADIRKIGPSPARWLPVAGAEVLMGDAPTVCFPTESPCAAP